MKKNFKYAWLGAIALTGAMGFTACSSDNDVVAEKDVNPTYNPETNSVTTQFVLNVAGGEMQSTRQSSAIVQKNNNFRGIQNARLIALTTNHDYSATNPTYWLAPFDGTSTAQKSYDLGTLYGTNAVNNNGENNAQNSSHRVVELTLPLKTNAMLVYGRAIQAGNTEENGKVNYNVSETPQNTTFSLVSRIGENSGAYTQTCNLAALILNRVMLSEVAAHDVSDPITRDADGSNATTDDQYTQQATLPALSWREIGAKTPEEIADMVPLQENLATAYNKIATTYSDDATVHAGSATAICDVVRDIYTIANNVSKATATTDAELNAQRLADVIRTRIGYYFDASSDPYTFHNLGEASTDGSAKKYLIDNAGLTTADFEEGGKYSKVTDTYLKTFPIAFNLPAGVSQLEFVPFAETGTGITGGFRYKTLENSHSLIDISHVLDVSKYTYPSELLYFDNSLLRVSDNEKNPNDYPNGYNTWDAEDQWASSDWSIGKVSSTTRSVAVKNNINYGVAMLQTNVIVDDAVTTGFKDNRPVEENVTLTANEIKGFKLTGVLIGGQYKELGWNYLSSGDGTSNANKDFVIYDNKIADQGILTSGTPNYTLVFDNYNGSTTTPGQTDVLVALEFENGNDKDIYGIGGMIPKGAKFYLVGKLEIGSKSITSWPETYAIPPYNTNGESQKVTRVFIQDYMTTATFKIGEESLKKAYTTVPDLRASQTSLGLSVDLNWRTGLNFDDVVLGQ